MTQIDVISGFLGAGKTTLIKKLIAQAYRGEKLVLIENEFGRVNIDGSFLRDQALTVTEINSGCICCSLAGDFTAAILEAAKKWKPQRILIEPSGVGKLSEIGAAVESLCRKNPGLAPGCRITVVDPIKLDTYLASFAEFYEDQIRAAELLVLSRTQSAAEQTIRQAVEELGRLNPNAAIVTTAWAQLDGRQILKACKKGPELADELIGELESETQHHHHAEDLFTSWSALTAAAIAPAALETALAELNTGKYGAILRAKGILPGTQGTWLEFDYVPGEQQIRPASPDITGKLCVIGVGLNKRGLSELFAL